MKWSPSVTNTLSGNKTCFHVMSCKHVGLFVSKNEPIINFYLQPEHQMKALHNGQ